MTAKNVIEGLATYAKPDDAVFLQRFFKTGKGEYGEGDVFIGIRVPQIRAVCKQYVDMSLSEVQKLFSSPVHEHRLAAALILTYKYMRADSKTRTQIYELYLKNVRSGRVNNWDIIDTSAEFVIGRYLWDNKLPHTILFDLASSQSLWCRRAAILSSFYFLQKGDATTTLRLATKLLHDPHDLIQKAVGWMLREIGKRIDRQLLLNFLDKHAASMPRTTLRYSLEHLSVTEKAKYMRAKAHA